MFITAEELASCRPPQRLEHVDPRIVHAEATVAAALALRSSKLTYSRISRILNVPLNTVVHWCRGNCRKRVRPDFSALERLGA